MLKQRDNNADIVCWQRYAESHSGQMGYVHGARKGNRTCMFQERKRYTRSNLVQVNRSLYANQEAKVRTVLRTL